MSVERPNQDSWSQPDPAAPSCCGGNIRAFVVLRHTEREGTHYDLMIDTGAMLATWKLPKPPEQAAGGPINCTRLADHRRQYLDYEGDISGDRGSVIRHDLGDCTVSRESPGGWTVEFRGRHLQGRVDLNQADAERDSWLLVLEDA